MVMADRAVCNEIPLLARRTPAAGAHGSRATGRTDERPPAAARRRGGRLRRAAARSTSAARPDCPLGMIAARPRPAAAAGSGGGRLRSLAQPQGQATLGK
jgi:hypothetical protein